MPNFIGITGHRPRRLNGCYDPRKWKPAIEVIKGWLMVRSGVLYNQEVDFPVVFSGMADGFDMMAAAATVMLKDGGHHAELHLAIPHANQTRKWTNPLTIKWYERLIERADFVHQLSMEDPEDDDDPRSAAARLLWERDQWVVHRSAEMLACWDGGRDSGTWKTIKYAYERQIGVTNLYDDIMKALR